MPYTRLPIVPPSHLSKIKDLILKSDASLEQKQDLICEVDAIKEFEGQDWFMDVRDVHVKLVPSRVGANGPVMGIHPACMATIKEEYDELLMAIGQNDLATVVDACLDLVYVILGYVVFLGVDPRPIWDEIQRANLAKEGGELREDNKFLKPDGWKAPDVEGLLELQRMEHRNIGD